MATNYPGSLDTSSEQPSPSATTEMDDVGFEHDVVHTNHSGAIIALETKVGTGSSTAVADSVLAGTGAGTSSWSTSPTLSGLEVDGNLGVGTSSPVDPLHVVGDVTIEFSDDGSLAQPEVTLQRNSTTPDNGDYLGQIKFAGKNDAGQTVNYAKITGKISDVTDTTEDGLIEVAMITAGSQNIGYRLTSTDLKLINGVGLQVDGDVGIGTTSPSFPLHVNGGNANSIILAQSTDATARVNMRDSATSSDTHVGVGAVGDDLHVWAGNAQRLTVDSDGNVGIGITSPASELEISTDTGGGASATELRISSTGNSSSWSTTNPWGRLDFWNGDGSGGGAKSHASLRAVASEALGQYSDLEFHVTNGSAADITAMTIEGSTGNVGIGTTSPGAALEVVGDIIVNDPTPRLVLEDTGTGTSNASVQMRDGADTVLAQIKMGGSNDLYFDVAGLTRMFIRDNGKVGIGTTSPASRLEVRDSLSTLTLTSSSTVPTANTELQAIDFYQSDASGGAGVSARIVGSANNSSGAQNIEFHTGQAGAASVAERMRIDSNGKVGIGTTSPVAELEVRGSSSPEIRLVSSDASDPAIYFGDSVDPVRAGLYYDTSENRLHFRGYNNNNRMVIDSTGRVGIGTTTPSTTLELKHSGPRIRFNSSNTAVGDGTLLGGLEFYGNDATVSAGVGSFIAAYGDGTSGEHQLRFGTGTQGSTAFRMTIDHDGKVGIGTTTPSTTLDVNGSLSKNSGSFKIPHPLPEMTETHHLVHSFVEAPQADNIYRGRVALDGGTAEVNIDEVAGMTAGTFVLLNRDVQAFTSNETGPCRVWSFVSDGVLSIIAEHDDCDHEISWLVIGERQDQHMYDTEWTDEDGRVIVEPVRPVDDSHEENQTLEAQVAALEAEA